MSQDLTSLFQQSDETIAEMLADGHDPELEYDFEHHLASPDFAKLEKAAVELVKAGFHVEDADEFSHDAVTWFCCVAITAAPLDAQALREQVEKVANISQQCRVEYDGWGCDLGDDEGGDEDGYDEEE